MTRWNVCDASDTENALGQIELNIGKLKIIVLMEETFGSHHWCLYCQQLSKNLIGGTIAVIFIAFGYLCNNKWPITYLSRRLTQVSDVWFLLQES